MSEILPASAMRADVEIDVAIIGAGAAGLVAALRAAETGAEVLVLERDAKPTGSTSMSSGFVPAPATRFQRAIGIADDTPELFAADIAAKNHGTGDAALAATVSKAIGPALEWLADSHGLEWLVLDDFLYPGHSRHRMHAVPERTGAALLQRLAAAADAAGIMVATGAHVTGLFADGKKIVGCRIARADGGEEQLACKALVLACNGYGGDPDLVKQHIPEMASAVYHGHAGNRGDAVLWGEKLGAELRHLSGYQGHGSLAYPQQILITWAVMMEGGIQVNANGERFSNEHGGYSEQAVNVLAQPGGFAWNVYDRRIHDFALNFPDYREAFEASAIRTAPDARSLAAAISVDADRLEATLSAVGEMQCGATADPFGRDFTTKLALAAPFYAVKVTGALFHTQGGLVVDETARVLGLDGSPFPNLFATGGAACGVSGPDVSGYLSGNGLLTAIALGYLAGEAAGTSR
ncbi:FAD-dependent oxidoreductase [Aminobacter sp. J44]|nr:FAD-dependent oxidoreductase [Aminobacter sp. J44]TWG53786.1 fumarate reductase flavoprotein subunit [Aminobacter sp. J44]